MKGICHESKTSLSDSDNELDEEEAQRYADRDGELGRFLHDSGRSVAKSRGSGREEEETKDSWEISDQVLPPPT
jgi:hypothetical protein